MVIPDRIYLTILLTEKDSKGKKSVEELEKIMGNKLSSMGIDLSKQLSLFDVSSNFKKYFLKQQDILKAKSFSLLVYDAKTAGKVIVGLEEEQISNVFLEKTEYSKIEELKLELKSRAIQKAKKHAVALTKPLGQQVGAAIFISDLKNISYALNGYVAGINVVGYSSSKLKEKEFEPLDIEFQKIKVEEEVQVKFKLD